MYTVRRKFGIELTQYFLFVFWILLDWCSNHISYNVNSLEFVYQTLVLKKLLFIQPSIWYFKIPNYQVNCFQIKIESLGVGGRERNHGTLLQVEIIIYKQKPCTLLQVAFKRLKFEGNGDF